MVCLLHGLENENEGMGGLGNENETHIYLVKCNLGIGIKCVGPTQFENKKWK